MRIALVSQEYPPETARGGLGTQTYAKACGLGALGHDVHVVSHSVSAHETHRRDGRIWVHRIPGMDDRLSIATDAVRWLTWSITVAAVLEKLHEQQPLDLIDFPEWGAEGYAHLLNCAEGQRPPVVIQLHGPLVMLSKMLNWPDQDSSFYRTGVHMEGTCLRLADAVYSSSTCSATWCEQEYGLVARNIPVIHTGVETDRFRPLEQKSSRPTIVFVGRIVENKGVELLLDAAVRLSGEIPDLRVRLCGGGEPRLMERLQRRAVEVGCENLLELVGFVDREELPWQLATSHVFAAPSIYEGGPGFVYLEAMSCGLPVIACAGSGASECIRHGETGLLVRPSDLDALTEALRNLFSDDDLRRSMGRAARESVVKTSDSRDCLNRLNAFYESVVLHGTTQ